MSQPAQAHIIQTLADLAEHLGCSASSDNVARRLYKDTACGINFYYKPPLNQSYGYVVVSGYAEGTDEECPSYTLHFPFSSDDFDTMVENADKDGCDLFDSLEDSE